MFFLSAFAAFVLASADADADAQRRYAYRALTEPFSFGATATTTRLLPAGQKR